jgi:hypothetical protein
LGGGAADSEDLRRQIRALEGRLRQAETEQSGDQRVTELGGGTRARGREPEIIVRMYDLSDLFTVAPPYPALQSGDLSGKARVLFPMPAGDAATRGGGGASGMGGMGGGFFRVEERPKSVVTEAKPVLGQNTTGKVDSVRSSIDDLVDAITTTINPTGWDSVGGPGSIATLSSSLLISTDLRTHEQIESLFEQLRKRWGTLRTVSVRADWLWLTDAQADALLLEADKPAKGDDLRAFGLVDETAWKKQQEQQAKAGQGRGGWRAVLTCYNGQTVHALSGGQSVAVAGMMPVVGGKEGAEGGVGYQPDVQVIQEGAALQVTPITNISGKFVILDIHSRVAHLRPGGERQPRQDAARAAPLGPAAAAAALDRPMLMLHRLSTTLRVPVERRMLIGGMSYESEPQPGEPNLYLFVKLSVQELRDDVPKAKTEPPAAAPPAKPAKPAAAKAK